LVPTFCGLLPKISRSACNRKLQPAVEHFIVAGELAETFWAGGNKALQRVWENESAKWPRPFSGDHVRESGKLAETPPPFAEQLIASGNL